tara:strand:- start:2257 stop:2415 length:159 start_codon:yes stop_codon:yes gene_type:complete
MNRQEMLQKISILHKTLKTRVLTIADKVAIRNEIGQLQDKLLRLDDKDGLID